MDTDQHALWEKVLYVVLKWNCCHHKALTVPIFNQMWNYQTYTLRILPWLFTHLQCWCFTLWHIMNKSEVLCKCSTWTKKYIKWYLRGWLLTYHSEDNCKDEYDIHGTDHSHLQCPLKALSILKGWLIVPFGEVTHKNKCYLLGCCSQCSTRWTFTCKFSLLWFNLNVPLDEQITAKKLNFLKGLWIKRHSCTRQWSWVCARGTACQSAALCTSWS